MLTIAAPWWAWWHSNGWTNSQSQYCLLPILERVSLCHRIEQTKQTTTLRWRVMTWAINWYSQTQYLEKTLNSTKSNPFITWVRQQWIPWQFKDPRMPIKPGRVQAWARQRVPVAGREIMMDKKLSSFSSIRGSQRIHHFSDGGGSTTDGKRWGFAMSPCT